ncbi:MFS family permease [Pseudarthrobacter sp. W1I19]|nr:MFS family permease [Pseudarthrobacter sp. W1I19]
MESSNKAMTTLTTGDVDKKMSPQGRKAMFGAQGGLFVDMFDVYLPIIVMAPAAIYFQATGISDSASRILTAVVFVATMLGRPLGALIFGNLSDRTGRRRTTLISLIGFGFTTLLIASLPGNEQIGVWAIILLITLRFVDGVFLGGQYTASAPLALETSPHHKRGLIGSFIMTGFPLAYCATGLITFGLLQIIPAGSLHSPYVQWGWRLPFVLGGLMALVFAWWYARNVKESAVWEKTVRTGPSPIVQLFRGSNLRGFLQVFLLMSGNYMSFNMVGAVLPGVLKQYAGLKDTEVTMVMIIAYALLALTYLGAGLFSQRAGRRPFFMIQGVMTATVAPVLYWLVASKTVTGLPAVGLVTVALILVVVTTWGVVTTYIIERFHTGVRSSGYGLGYSLAVVIPSFYAFYQAGLTSFMPFEYTPLVLLVLGGILLFVGAAIGPETKDVDLASGAEVKAVDGDALAGSLVGVPYAHDKNDSEKKGK